MDDFIPYGRQTVTSSDIESVVETLKSEYLTQGPMVPRFENSISTLTSARILFSSQ